MSEAIPSRWTCCCDEAHHCYREKPGEMTADALKGDEKKEARKENEAARLWINGIEAFKRKLGVRNVVDLSATPFFLRTSIPTERLPSSTAHAVSRTTRATESRSKHPPGKPRDPLRRAQTQQLPSPLLPPNFLHTSSFAIKRLSVSSPLLKSWPFSRRYASALSTAVFAGQARFRPGAHRAD